MIRFQDGPAAGVELWLQRAPIFLRVVYNPALAALADTWDALDQLDDVPAADEAVVVYRRVGNAGALHLLCARGKGGRHRSGWYATGEYVLHAEQPTDEIVRSTAKWRNWCEVERDRLIAQQAETAHG